jgi:hypothetical protein
MKKIKFMQNYTRHTLFYSHLHFILEPGTNPYSVVYIKTFLSWPANDVYVHCTVDALTFSTD